MKKLLMYIMVAIVVVTCGITIYYVVRNDEEITSTIADDSVYYMNIGETLPIPLEYKNPSPHTDFTYSIQSEFDMIVDLDNWTITANEAGIVTIKFTSSNENYSNFDVSCYVGNGTSLSPWYIRNVDDLKKVGNGEWALTDCYQLTNDIDVGGEMLPIGVTVENGKASLALFTGSLSGGNNSYAIKNAQVTQQGYVQDVAVGGFFAGIGSTGRIENVVFENITVSGEYNYAGVVAGVNYGLIGKCEIKNSKVVNSQAEMAYTGGICGLNKHEAGSSNYAQINMCTSDVSIISKWVAGGAVGYNDGGVVFNCKIKTSELNIAVADGVDDTYSYFGGVAGISNCDVVDGEPYDSYVANCLVYISGVRNTTSKVRGVFGAYYGISDVYNARGNYNMILYIAESNLSPYYIHLDTVKISNENPSQARYFVNQISHSVVTDAQTFTSHEGSTWDVGTEKDSGNIWIISQNEIFINKNAEYQQFPLNGETFEIKTEEELETAFNQMRQNPSSNTTYLVTDVISMNLKNENWTPIGTKTNPFMGQILTEDGGLIVLRNVKIESDDDYVGIFAYTAGVTTKIQGLYVYNLTINGGPITGGIVGFNDSATIENCTVVNFNLTGEKYIGAIAGYNSGSILNCNINMLYSLPYDLYEKDGEFYLPLANAGAIVDAEGNAMFVVNGYNVYNETLYYIASEESASLSGLSSVSSIKTTNDSTDSGNENDGEQNEGVADEEGSTNDGDSSNNNQQPVAPTYEPINVADIFADTEFLTQKLIGTSGNINIKEENSAVMYVGGYVGKNVGTIESGYAGSISIVAPVAEQNDTLYVGGATGLNLGKIKSVWVDKNLTISASLYSGVAYAGGIVGYQAEAGSQIESSVVGDQANNIQFRLENKNIVAGAIAGFVGEGTVVKYSSAKVIIINASTVGGFAGIVNGLIEESYLDQTVEIIGNYAGGFAVTLNGTIRNSMSATTINGKNVQTGMVVYLRKGSLIEKSFIDVAFSGQGKTYAETMSAFRLSSDKFGTIKNSIIVGSVNGSLNDNQSGSNINISDILEMFPLYLQTGLVNGHLAPYVIINGTNAEMQAYFVWWWKGFKGEETDGILAASSEVSGNGMALISAGFDEKVWSISSTDGIDTNYYVLPVNAVGYDAQVRTAQNGQNVEGEAPNQGEQTPGEDVTNTEQTPGGDVANPEIPSEENPGEDVSGDDTQITDQTPNEDGNETDQTSNGENVGTQEPSEEVSDSKVPGEQTPDDQAQDDEVDYSTEDTLGETDSGAETDQGVGKDEIAQVA